MQELDDLALLREYATNNSEIAFQELVSRRVNFVYSAALRQTRNPHLAEEITQAVFIILARKAGKISDKTILTGWLFKTTRFAALAQMRAIIKRQQQEKEFQMQTEFQSAATDELWNQMSPLLDEALAALGETDRQAVLLRFFENKSLAEVGNFLGIGEDTARKRISRALEKLHRYFSKRGVSLTTVIIAGTISANSVHAAPMGLTKTISAVAISKGAVASTSTLTLIKGALKIMAWSKVKTAIVASVIVLLAAGTTTVTVKKMHDRKYYAWEVPKANFEIFYDALPQITILQTKFKDKTDGGYCCDSSRGAMGIAQPLKQMIEMAYQQDNLHTVVAVDLPTDRYDFLAKLVGPRKPRQNIAENENWSMEFQNAIIKKFGIKGQLEMRNTDVLVLKPNNVGIHGFKASHSMPNGMAVKPILKPEQNGARVGNEYHEQPLTTFISTLQQRLQVPIVDETGLTNDYDFSFSWIQSPDKHDLELQDVDQLNPLLADQLGLELVPTNMPIEMLVVEKAK